MAMPTADPALRSALVAIIAARRIPGRMLVVGICGAQGSGKTTLARDLAADLGRAGVSSATLSLDDLYLTRAERLTLAAQVHPLLVTRGVPGTHDVALGLATLDALAHGAATPLPRFDKARDDRAPVANWPISPAKTQVLLFEGWCVGALAQQEAALTAPINALERDEDAEGIWRQYANRALTGPYRQLFARIDVLALLAAPGFEVVQRWRGEQESKLRRADPSAPGLMDEAGIARFIQHYERLTRHILTEMLARADLVAQLDEGRRVLSITSR